MHNISQETRRGIILSIIPVLAGVAIQYAIGPADIRAIAFPVNAYIGAGFVFLLLFGFLLRKSSAFVNGLTSLATAIPAIVSVIAVTLIAGIVTQKPGSDSAWHDMLSSWPFIFAYTWMAVILGMAVIKDLSTFCFRKAPVAFNHAGLFIALTAGALGSADVCRLDMTVHEGFTEWQTVDSDSRIAMAPFGITLDSLDIRNSHDNMPEQVSAYITVDRKSGTKERATIKVNHPVRVDGLDIYLSDYAEADTGRPATAIFQLVSDPWLPAVYAGIAMMAVGALLTLFIRPDRKKLKT